MFSFWRDFLLSQIPETDECAIMTQWGKKEGGKNDQTSRSGTFLTYFTHQLVVNMAQGGQWDRIAAQKLVQKLHYLHFYGWETSLGHGLDLLPYETYIIWKHSSIQLDHYTKILFWRGKKEVEEKWWPIHFFLNVEKREKKKALNMVYMWWMTHTVIWVDEIIHPLEEKKTCLELRWKTHINHQPQKMSDFHNY